MLKGFVSGEEKDIVRIPMKGKNLFDNQSLENGYINSSGNAASAGSTKRTDYIPVEAGSTYTLTTEIKIGIGHYLAIYNAEKSKIGNTVDIRNLTTVTVNIPENGAFVRFSMQSGDITKTTMFNKGSALPYEPYGYQEGWEVRDNQDRLIWGREDELQTATGTLPFKGYSLPLKMKSLLGNAVQNGTPAPDNIIMPEMCGVRTGNLFDGTKYVNTSINSTERWEYSTSLTGSVYRIPCKPNTTYTLYLTENIDITIWRICDVSTNAVPNTQSTSVPITGSHANSVPASKSATFTTSSNAKYILFQTNESAYASVLRVIMLVEGTTKIPYEPYGWKVPFENHGENLFDTSSLTNNMQLDNTTGLPVSYTGRIASQNPVDVSQYSTVTISYVAATTIKAIYTIFSNNELIGRFTAVSSGTAIDVSNADKMYICFYSTWGGNIDASNVSNIMLTPGSEAKPYSPYLNETLPVYLGEVPTVRRIKKLVLDGTENWVRQSGQSVDYFRIENMPATASKVICSHYQSPDENIAYATVVTGIKMQTSASFGVILACRPPDIATLSLSDFKAFLASEYSAGHPVTIWYVLANEETTISNEPLAKIGTYADELATIQVHGLSAPLYGIGDYKDTLNLSTGVVTRKVKKLVLTGQEDIPNNDGTSYNSTFSTDRFVRNIDKAPESNGTDNIVVCTHITFYAQVWAARTRTGCCIYCSGNTMQLHLRFDNKTLGIEQTDTNEERTAKLKAYHADQYAAGTPVTVWYVLSTPETETVTVPTGMTGEIEGYLTQVSTPTPTNRSVPKWNGVEETGGTYAVTVYTPPEIPTTTGQNTLTVDTDLVPSNLIVKGHIKELT